MAAGLTLSKEQDLLVSVSVGALTNPSQNVQPWLQPTPDVSEEGEPTP